MAKSLVVFYSLEGNCRFLADCISKAINADVMELKPKKDVESKGFMKYVWGGRQAVMKTKPELLATNINVAEYDLIFIGTPVWASTYTPAINTFLSDNDLKGKKLAIFCCYDGNEGKTFLQMKKALEGSEIIGEMGFTSPNKDKTNNSKLVANWALEMLKKL